MSHPPDPKKVVAFPEVIRNLKPQRWPTIAMRLCLLCAGMGCLLAIGGTLSGFPRELIVLLYAPTMLGMFGAVVFAIGLLFSQPIDKLLLGDVLEIWPDKTRYQVRDILRIEFVSGPEEDYAEVMSAQPSRDVRITVPGRFRFQPIRVTMSTADAARLNEWAMRHGIRLTGADRVRR